MPSLSQSGLVTRVEEAAIASGYTISRLSDDGEVPARFLLSGPAAESFAVLVYIKNLTPADRSDPDEYRIQLRSKLLPLQFERYATTVLLGYHQPSGLFVGFDPRALSTTARTQISAGYVSLSVVRRARRRGMTFDRDRRDRIAVGIRPELLVAYCLHSSELHEAADDRGSVTVLNRAVAPFSTTAGRGAADENEPPTPRQRLVRTVNVLSRDAGFRTRVLQAYEHRCVVTQVQLGLVDAAHILPVSIPDSHDRVVNGLSLLPQLHRAFDSGLIYLTPRYEMRVNDRRVRELTAKSLVDGLDDLRGSLGRIRLPRERRNWPDPALIRRANRARKIEVT